MECFAWTLLASLLIVSHAQLAINSPSDQDLDKDLVPTASSKQSDDQKDEDGISAEGIARTLVTAVLLAILAIILGLFLYKSGRCCFGVPARSDDPCFGLAEYDAEMRRAGLANNRRDQLPSYQSFEVIRKEFYLNQRNAAISGGAVVQDVAFSN